MRHAATFARLSGTKPLARNGLSLACNDSRFRGLHSRVNVPGLLLRWLACVLHRPFGSQAPQPLPGLPRKRLLPRPKTRCGFFRRLPELPDQLPLPFGIFTSLRIEAFSWICRPAARLPNSPDFRSLPAARRYLTRFGLRITVPGPLRFRRLAVPQTSWNLPHYAPKTREGQ